jgi:hypothetical protein
LSLLQQLAVPGPERSIEALTIDGELGMAVALGEPGQSIIAAWHAATVADLLTSGAVADSTNAKERARDQGRDR